MARMSETSTSPVAPAVHGGMTPAGITYAGMGLNIALSAAKMTLGLLVGSQALFAEGLHSLSDLASDVAVLAGLRVSHKPADPEHPYGHRRVQTLVTMFIGAMLAGLAIWAATAAIRRWLAGEHPRYGLLPFALLMVSTVVKEWLFHATRRVGRRHADTSLIANAWHHRSDAFASLATAAGVLAVAVGGPAWGFLDHVTAIALGAVLGVMGLKLIAQAGQELVDRAPSRHVLETIERTVAGTEGVRSYHAVRIRQLGGALEMDVHVQVDPALTVVEGHDIASEVRRRVFEADRNVTVVLVHVEPANERAQQEDGPVYAPG